MSQTRIATEPYRRGRARDRVISMKVDQAERDRWHAMALRDGVTLSVALRRAFLAMYPEAAEPDLAESA